MNTLPALIGVLLLAPLTAPRAASPPGLKPNFLVILCDDLGYGDLACQGHPHVQTPHLDHLARDGIRFTSCYSAAPVCSPARVGLLTGRTPNRAGVFDWIPAFEQSISARNASRHLVHLRQEEITLPRLLRDTGYATALCGKWHCNSRFNHPDQPQPGDAGFEHWFATQNNAVPSHENPTNFIRNGLPVGPLTGYSCRLVAREAIGWLQDQHDRHQDKPFFLYVAFHEPHEPVASPPELVRKYLSKARNEDEAQYFANIENLDAAVGELLGALDRLDLACNTLVFFTSDNGPETLNRYATARRSYGTAGPCRGMKLWTTDGGLRVPGIMRWPANLRAGQVSDEPISALDILPTFTALAGSEVRAGLRLDGANLSPLLTGGRLHRTQPLFWVYFQSLNHEQVAMREGPWKLLARLDGGKLPRVSNVTQTTAPRVRQARLSDFALYRVTDDISETRDLSAQEPDKLMELSGKLESLYRDLTATMHVWPDAP